MVIFNGQIWLIEHVSVTTPCAVISLERKIYGIYMNRNNNHVNNISTFELRPAYSNFLLRTRDGRFYPHSNSRRLYNRLGSGTIINKLKYRRINITVSCQCIYLYTYIGIQWAFSWFPAIVAHRRSRSNASDNNNNNKNHYWRTFKHRGHFVRIGRLRPRLWLNESTGEYLLPFRCTVNFCAMKPSNNMCVNVCIENNLFFIFIFFFPKCCAWLQNINTTDFTRKLL